MERTYGIQPVVVGGVEGCELRLTDPTVSRRHAELSLDVAGVRVRDLDSTNGIRSHGGRVYDVVVPFGGSIELGDTSVRLERPSSPVVPPSSRRSIGGLVGESLAMREVFTLLELAGPTDATILIQGESGTGKELAARAIHDLSARASGPFVIVDCGAATEQLIESDFFGHIRGAFTGALRDRNGAFVEAGGGTVFLDEIGDLPLASQAKLLRALEARTVKPLGSDAEVGFDARVVAATHRDLCAMVADGAFRFDLFHRLAVVHIVLPPLRERLDDLPILIDHFHAQQSRDPGKLGGENLRRLQSHAWPGNVRELRNVLERATVLSPSDTAFADLRLWLDSTGTAPSEAFVDLEQPFKDAKEAWNDVFERRYIAALYERHHKVITRAAEAAGLSRRHFSSLLRKHGIANDA